MKHSCVYRPHDKHTGGIEMAEVLIGHARRDENGGIDGPLQGDNDGGEVCEQEYYAKNKAGVGWAYVLRCKNEKLRTGLVAFIRAACKNNGIGYSQPNRSQLLKALKAGGTVQTVKADTDCTALIFAFFITNGVKVAQGYSANMHRLLMATGLLDCFTDAAHLGSSAYLQAGDILLRTGHAATVLTNGAKFEPVEAVPDETPCGAFVQILGTGNTVNVRGMPGTAPAGASAAERKKYNAIYTARSGESFPWLGTAASGWYQVQTPRGIGYISCNLPRYVRAVKG